MKKIGWLVSNVKSGSHEEVLTSELASSRLRSGICIRGAKKSGFEVLPLNLVDSHSNIDILFIGKYVHDSGTGKFFEDSGVRYQIWLDKVSSLRKKGVKVVLDYTDHHFQSKTIVGDFYREIKKYVDIIVVPSNLMKIHLMNYWDGSIYVIPEPIEVSLMPPKKYDGKRMLWFGHSSNLIYLYKAMLEELTVNAPSEILILTNALLKSDLISAAEKIKNKVSIKVYKWSIEKMVEVSPFVDYLFIPSDLNDIRKNGASPGRLLTGLALGLPVIATPLDSYCEFRNYFSIIGSQDAREIMEKSSLGFDQVLTAQRDVLPAFTVDAVGGLWVDMINDALNGA